MKFFKKKPQTGEKGSEKSPERRGKARHKKGAGTSEYVPNTRRGRNGKGKGDSEKSKMEKPTVPQKKNEVPLKHYCIWMR